jgi:hypothetical protein
VYCKSVPSELTLTDLWKSRSPLKIPERVMKFNLALTESLENTIRHIQNSNYPCKTIFLNSYLELLKLTKHGKEYGKGAEKAHPIALSKPNFKMCLCLLTNTPGFPISIIDYSHIFFCWTWTLFGKRQGMSLTEQLYQQTILITPNVRMKIITKNSPNL